jgi:mevalonate kinase
MSAQRTSGTCSPHSAGLEISLLAATPKGSGLGTSSILAATLLGTLSEICGLGWDADEVTARTLVLEQLLTTGGGWQDQAGGIHRGLKMVESAPGLVQRTAVRWLPEHLLAEAVAGGTALLYYTGTTRVAKSILEDIARGMFLNRSATVSLIDEIAAHARESFDLLHRQSWEGLCTAVRRSWELNCALDAGTNPPEVQGILSRIADWTAAAKLAGAGGGATCSSSPRMPKRPPASARNSLPARRTPAPGLSGWASPQPGGRSPAADPRSAFCAGSLPLDKRYGCGTASPSGRGGPQTVSGEPSGPGSSKRVQPPPGRFSLRA